MPLATSQLPDCMLAFQLLTACVRMGEYVHMHVCVCVHMCVYVCVCMHVCMHVCVCVCVCTCACECGLSHECVA